jgi:hypothetical protein
MNVGDIIVRNREGASTVPLGLITEILHIEPAGIIIMGTDGRTCRDPGYFRMATADEIRAYERGIIMTQLIPKEPLIFTVL